jgi:hypothetical protein
MAAIHASTAAGETEVVLAPLVVTALVNNTTATPLYFSGAGEPITSSDTVVVTATGGTGPYSVAFAYASGYVFSTATGASSTAGYTGNSARFQFEIPFAGTESTNFTASVTDLGGSGKTGSKTFNVTCTRLS